MTIKLVCNNSFNWDLGASGLLAASKAPILQARKSRNTEKPWKNDILNRRVDSVSLPILPRVNQPIKAMLAAHISSGPSLPSHNAARRYRNGKSEPPCSQTKR